MLLVLAATTMVMLALTACGGGLAQEEKAKARPLPEDEKPLRPGEYRSEEFKPSLSFRVGDTKYVCIMVHYAKDYKARAAPSL